MKTLAFLGLGWLLAILTTTIAALVPVRVPVPEVLLLVTVFLGLRARSSTPAVVALALGFGYLQDLLAGAPRGLHALALGATVVLARSAASRLDVSARWQVGVVALVAALLHGSLVVLLSASMYQGAAARALAVVPGVAVMTALASPLVFLALGRLERRLYPDPSRLRMGG